MKNNRELTLEDGTRVPHRVLSPLRAMMRSLSAKWKLEVLFALGEGHCRFGEIMRATPGITQHMLTLRLRELEAEGFVTRRDFGELPLRVEYTPTAAADELRPIFEALFQWARNHRSAQLGKDQSRLPGVDGSVHE